MLAKKIFVVLGFIYLFTFNAESQTGSGWVFQNPNFHSGNYQNAFKLSPSEFWFSGYYGNILFTSNGGNNFSEIIIPTDDYIIPVSFINQNTGIIAAINEYGSKLYKTNDRGKHNQLIFAANKCNIKSIKMFNASRYIILGERKDKNKNYAVTYTTFDGGINWNINEYFDISGIHDAVFINNSTGYFTGRLYGVNSSNIIYKTTDSGNSFFEIMNSGEYIFSTIQFPDQNTGYIITTPANILKTTNNGANWEIKETPFVIQTFCFPNSLTGYASGYTGRTFALYKTTNGGDNWHQLSIIKSNSVSNIFAPTPQHIWELNHKNITKSTDGGNIWAPVREWQDLNAIEDIYFKNEMTGWAAGMWNSIYQTTNGGDTWLCKFKTDTGSTGYFRSIKFLNENTGLAAGGNYRAYTTDGGDNWQFEYDTEHEGLTRIACAGAYTYYSIENNLFKASFHKSTDYGHNWSLISEFNNSQLWDIKFFGNMTGYITGTYHDYNQAFTFINKTSNGGLNWTEIYRNYFASIRRFDFTDINTGWIAGNKSDASLKISVIYKTTDGGLNWNEIYTDSLGAFFDIKFFNQNYGTAAGYSGRIIVTTNGGTNWIIPTNNAGSPLTCVYYLNQNVLWSAGESGVIIKSTTGGISYSGNTNVIQIPVKFHLYQNYPNPFNPVTNIRFELPESDIVNIKIFDITGRLVEVLYNGYLNAGTYTRQWNASAYSSGIYLYQIRTGKFTESKKMVFAK